jgi:hypothetical protein
MHGRAWCEMAYVVAMLHRGEGTLSVDTPDLLQDGLEPNAMLVDGPELDAGVGESRRHLMEQRAQTRLEQGLRHGVSLHVAWAWLEEARAQVS